MGFEVQGVSPYGHQPGCMYAMSKQFGLNDRSVPALTVPVSRISITMGYNKFFSQPDAFFLLSERKLKRDKM